MRDIEKRVVACVVAAMLALVAYRVVSGKGVSAESGATGAACALVVGLVAGAVWSHLGSVGPDDAESLPDGEGFAAAPGSADPVRRDVQGPGRAFAGCGGRARPARGPKVVKGPLLDPTGDSRGGTSKDVADALRDMHDSEMGRAVPGRSNPEQFDSVTKGHLWDVRGMVVPEEGFGAVDAIPWGVSPAAANHSMSSGSFRKAGLAISGPDGTARGQKQSR